MGTTTKRTVEISLVVAFRDFTLPCVNLVMTFLYPAFESLEINVTLDIAMNVLDGGMVQDI